MAKRRASMDLRLREASLALAALLTCGGPVAAQVIPGRQGPPRKREVFIDIDEAGTEMLRRAKRYSEIGDWALAVQTYDRILTERKFAGMLTRDPKTKLITGLRTRVQNIIRGLPPEGRHAYELLRGVDARRAWENAGSGDPEALRAVVQRFPASGFAGKASVRLAEIGLESGLVDQAVVSARTALTDFAEELSGEDRLTALRIWAYCEALRRRPGNISEVVKKIEAVDAAAATAARERANALFASLPKRLSGKPPELSTTEWVHEFSDFYPEAPFIQPRSLPILARGALVFHNSNYAYSLDAETGKLRWKRALKPGADKFKQPQTDCRVVSSGGRLFLSIDESALAGLDLASGQVGWRHDQEALKAAAQTSSGLRVSGRIAAEGGRVYVPTVSEGDNREHRVMAFDADSGACLWSTLYSVIRAGNEGGSTACLARGGKVYALAGDGVLACLEALDGGLAWVKEYGNGGQPAREPVLAVSSGRLLVAPPEGQAIFAFDPLTGAQIARGDNRGRPWILGVFRGSFVRLFRNGQLRCGRGGQRLVATLDTKVRLAARPQMFGKFLYLPLGDGLLVIDLTDGGSKRHKGWGKLERPSQVIPSDERVLAVAPHGACSIGSAENPAPGWAKDQAKLADGAFLAGRLGAASWRERDAAFDALLALGAAGKAAIEARSGDADPEVALRVSDLLHELGREARRERWRDLVRPEWIAAVPDLINRLTHRNSEVRLEALRRLGKIEDSDVLALFIDLLDDKVLGNALEAAALLYAKGRREGVRVFERALKEGDLDERKRVLETLATRAERSDRKRDLPLIRKALADEHPDMRKAAIALAARFGDRLVIPDLKGMLKDPKVEVRAEAITYLGELRLDAVGPILAPFVKDKDELIRARAVTALSHLETEVAARALCSACLDKNVPIARDAVEAVFKLAESPLAPRIPMEPLQKALKAKDQQVRDAVVGILLTRVNRPVSMLSELAMTLTEDSLSTVREGVLNEIFNRVSAADAEHVVKLADSKDPGVRFMAVQIIGKVSGLEAERALLKLLQDEDQQTRELASNQFKAKAHPQTVLTLLQRRAPAKAAAMAAKDEADAAKKALDALAELKKLEDKDPKKLPYRLAEARLKKANFVWEMAGARAAIFEDTIRDMDAEVEAPGLLLALDDLQEAVRAAAIEDLALIAGDRRGYKPKASAADRADARETWSLWYFSFKHPGANIEALIKELSAKSPRARIKAAETLRDLWNARAQRAIHEALKRERVLWVARELDRLLSDLTGQISGLKAKASPAELEACKAFWTKALAPQKSGQ